MVDMRAYPVTDYPAKCRQAAAIMHMIMNNLDPRVAQVCVCVSVCVCVCVCV